MEPQAIELVAVIGRIVGVHLHFLTLEGRAKTELQLKACG